jgi:hypothetical protein
MEASHPVSNLDAIERDLIEDLKTEKNVNFLFLPVLACITTTGYIVGAGIECCVLLAVLYVLLPSLLGEKKVDQAQSKRDIVRSIDALRAAAPSITDEEFKDAHMDI